MKTFIAAALAAASFGAAAADATCDGIAKSIDQSLRIAALANARAFWASDRDRERYDREAMLHLATINANIALATWNRCPAMKDPVGVPGIYSKAAGACGRAIFKARSEPPTGNIAPECVVDSWQRDTVQ